MSLIQSIKNVDLAQLIISMTILLNHVFAKSLVNFQEFLMETLVNAQLMVKESKEYGMKEIKLAAVLAIFPFGMENIV